MQRIASFMTVSRQQFAADWERLFPERKDGETAYASLRLPCRATAGSAGYDFYAPLTLTLAVGESAIIPTGMRARMEEGWVLCLYPRSGLGFKYRLQLDNTVGIIDSDYFGADNEGHILIKLTNDGKEGKPVTLEAGKAFAQGVFMPFGITTDDAADAARTGGLGSTTK